MALADVIQEIEDARVDAQSLEDFIFQPANVMVERRLAAPVNTLQYYVDYIANLSKGADGATGPIGPKGADGSFTQKSYTTYTAMDSDKANIPANTSVTITNDTDTTKNGMYAYNGTSFTKSAYDPLTQSKAYTDITKAETDKLKARAVTLKAVDRLKNKGSLYAATEYGKTSTLSATTGAAVLTTAIRFLNPLTSSAIIYSLDIYTSLTTQVKIAELTLNSTSGFDVVQISESTSLQAGVSSILFNTPLSVSKGSYLVIISSTAESLWYRGSSPADNGGYQGMTWDYNATTAGSNVANSGAVAAANYRLEASIGMYSEAINNASTINSSIQTVNSTLNNLFTNTYLGESAIPVSGGVDSTLTSAILAKPVENSGTLSYTEFYASKIGFLHLIVMEKLTDTQYKVITVSEKITVSAIGLQQVDLNTVIQVKSGQYVGWYQSAKVVKWVQKAGNTVQAVGFIADTSVQGSTFTPATALNADYIAQIKLKVSLLDMGDTIVNLTQAQYDALAIKNPKTIYVVV